MRKTFILAICMLALVVVSGNAFGYNSILGEWQTAYPGSLSDDNLQNSCLLCHGTNTGNFNAYGWAVRSNGIAAVESDDSDADPTGSSNLYEIQEADAQPGWTEGPNNTIYYTNGSTNTGQSPPALNFGDYDPTVMNNPPTADAGGPYNGTVDIPVSFDGSGSSDSDGMIDSYDWDFGDGNTGTGATPTHTYTSDGTFTVTLTVTDDAGATDTDTTTASVGLGNQPPAADAGGPYNGTVDIPVSFDGSGSSDPDGTIVAYDWDFGDGSTGTGATPTHTYTSDGTFNVTLTVTDDKGATDSVGTTATIGVGGNQSPTADPNGPYAGTVGALISFDGSGSFDPDGRIDSYDWDFGDGSTGTGATPTHTYTSDGTFTVTLTVTDDAGATDTGTTTATIGLVDNSPPVADANGPYNGTAGFALSFDGSGSFDPDGTIVAYDWDFGDGSTGTGATPTHTYTSDGTFTVTLTVTDDAGATDTDTTTASVGLGNQPPVADPNNPYIGEVGVAIQFDGSGSFDPDGTIVAYDWDFGDGNAGTGATPTHTYATEGIFNVTLTVTDDAGATDAAITTAKISPAIDDDDDDDDEEDDDGRRKNKRKRDKDDDDDRHKNKRRRDKDDSDDEHEDADED